MFFCEFRSAWNCCRESLETAEAKLTNEKRKNDNKEEKERHYTRKYGCVGLSRYDFLLVFHTVLRSESRAVEVGRSNVQEEELKKKYVTKYHMEGGKEGGGVTEEGRKRISYAVAVVND